MMKTLVIFIAALCLLFPSYSTPILDNQIPLLSVSTVTLSSSYFEFFKEAAELVDIAYCIAPGRGIGLPFECHAGCSDFPNVTLIHQFTGDNSLQTLTVTGYIAIDHSAKAIYLSLRGTRSFGDALVDIDSQQIPINHICLGCKIHKGFFETFDNTLLKVDEYLINLTRNFPDYNLQIIGHSLGGAIATLVTYHVLDKLKFKNLTCITMGAPILGNKKLSLFLQHMFHLESPDLSERFLYRITNKADQVPSLPITSGEDMYEQLAGEMFISNLDLASLRPNDVMVCKGKEDFNCIRSLYGGTFNSHLIYFKKVGYCGYGFEKS